MAKEIQLTRGQVALVDDEDYEWLNQWKWRAHIDNSTGNYYAARWQVKGEYTHFNKRKVVKMHRLLMGNPEGLEIDHKNRNTLDNRRDNLRIATGDQNRQNRGLFKNNKSGYKGVHWNNSKQKWVAQITVNGKQMQLGLFDTPVEAAECYKAAAEKYHGEFARIAVAAD